MTDVKYQYALSIAGRMTDLLSEGRAFNFSIEGFKTAVHSDNVREITVDQGAFHITWSEGGSTMLRYDQIYRLNVSKPKA